MAVKPVDEIPRPKWMPNEEKMAAARDLQEMIDKQIRYAEIVPACPEKHDRYPGGYSDKLNWAARYVRFHYCKTAKFKISYKRDENRKPHWYAELSFDGEEKKKM